MLDLILLGFVIGSNNLATALALGALGQLDRRLRVVTMFGAFEFVVPLIGIRLGRVVAESVEVQLAWLGPTLLVALGIFTVIVGVRHRSKDERLARLATTWWGLAVLASGLSLDNLVVGFGLGLGDVSALAVATTIALFSTAFTWVGMRLGASSRRHWERYSQIGAGVLLVGLGLASSISQCEEPWQEPRSRFVLCENFRPDGVEALLQPALEQPGDGSGKRIDQR